MGRCLLLQMQLPKEFWAEAENTTNCILNRTYTRVLKQKTSYEVWFKPKPSVTHLKTFGCVCYAKVPNEKRSKYKSVIALLMGYSEFSKGYRLYNIETKKIFISRDVNFDET